MIVEHKEQVRTDPECEVRIGTSSWDDDTISVKFTWFGKNGRACRGGEVPMDALPQMFEAAIREGYLKLAALDSTNPTEG